ncbi:hypothetical protein ACHAWT_001590 [Skeletonema menzelii]|mmetsp:Transcript_11228/g.18556  ORF Transcript_11228/g.18556 Transcript_11228/m.18556 type:complete len:172 (+) Transcript_11228:186-701(+)|eukprot:scaffold27890_cov166-Skeletonema_menzelii.AAC.2
MSTMSQPQQRNGARRAFGVINTNSTPRKASKGGASAVADEVHSAKKEKHSSLFAMATRSSKKRAASLKEADNKEVATVESPSKKPATANAVLPKASKALFKEEEVGEEYAKEVFRTLPEMGANFWDEMEDLLEIKLANPIGCEDEFDANSDADEEDKLSSLKEEQEVAGDV